MTTIDTTTALADDFDPEVTGPSPQALDDAPRPATLTSVPLDDIIERDGYTRTLNHEHVQLLADSINAVGLEQPLVLMSTNYLIAGQHRFNALHMLRTRNPERFERMFPGGMIPVQVFDLGERPDPDAILALEMSENNARRDYANAEEFARAVQVLSKKGYEIKRGRRKSGARPMLPMLMTMFGMSKATAHRALAAARSTGMVSGETITAAKPRGRKPKAINQDAEGGHAPAQAERDADQAAAAQLQALDRVAEARAVVEGMTSDELAAFAAWFKDYQSKVDDA